MAQSLITCSIEAGVARVILNRPERRNAMSRDMLGELARTTGELGKNDRVRVVVISGAGPVFSAGHDLSEMIGREQGFYEDLFARCTDVMLGLQSLPQPVIAQVHGMATAAGCQLVAACDLAVASTDCRFATPGVQIGLFCSTPMVPISRAIGRKRALQMLLTGEAIDAQTAADWGLINSAVPAEELDQAVQNLAARVMQFSRSVVATGKRAFYRQVDRPERAAYELVEPVMSANAGQADAQEGMQAFLEKRTPEWPGE